jgi:hypothetical protein
MPIKRRKTVAANTRDARPLGFVVADRRNDICIQLSLLKHAVVRDTSGGGLRLGFFSNLI